MRFEIDSNESTSLFHNSPGRRIGDWEDPLIRFNSLISDIVFESVSYLLRNKDNLCLFATFRISENKLSIFNISGSELQDLTYSHSTTGLEPSLKENGIERRQWIPKGLVIPLVNGGAVQRLRIRRDDPGDGSRYIIVSGSSSAPMVWGLERAAAVIVESELDGMLLSPEVGDLAGVVAMGSAQAKPDRITHEALTAVVIILVSLDTDDAGAKSSWQFWSFTYGKRAKRWPVPIGKDPSEAQTNGLDLREWITAGIFGTFERYERFCIQTIDGGLSDAEAIKGGRPVLKKKNRAGGNLHSLRIH